MSGKWATQLHRRIGAGLCAPDAYEAVKAAAARLGIGPADIMLTDAADDAPGGSTTRYRAWVRKLGWGIRFGRHAATIDEAVASLIAKLRSVA